MTGRRFERLEPLQNDRHVVISHVVDSPAGLVSDGRRMPLRRVRVAGNPTAARRSNLTRARGEAGCSTVPSSNPAGSFARQGGESLKHADMVSLTQRVAKVLLNRATLREGALTWKRVKE